MNTFEEYVENCGYEQHGYGFKDEWNNYYTFEEVQADYYNSIADYHEWLRDCERDSSMTWNEPKI